MPSDWRTVPLTITCVFAAVIVVLVAVGAQAAARAPDRLIFRPPFFAPAAC
jgi:hypothetical protein